MELFNVAFLASQVFWTGIAFGVLLIMMWFWVVPKITAVLDERAEQIRNDLTAAEGSRAQAEDMLAEYREQMAKAKAEAAAMVAKAKADAHAVADQRIADLEHELARKSQQAQAQIEAAKAKAMTELKSEVASLVLMATESILSEKLDKKTAQTYADKAIKQLSA